MTTEDLQFEFHRYVNNDIPIRLLAWDSESNIRLVERSDVKAYFQRRIDSFTEVDISEFQMRVDGWGLEDQDVVRALVRGIVQYATLSHRWSAEEVSFQNFGEGTKGDKTSLGWKKLRNFCDKARDYNVAFGWADTCCIDKTSSAELDESIRSMFRWYKNSSICIVHLAGTTNLETMRSDEWFRRGWTLQELLAPPKMRFYSQDWRALSGGANDKQRSSDVLWEVSLATGIDVDEICSFTPSSSERIDKRMVWAANRRVTRDEDTAYSLMGIFNISISIAYGEGHDRAFTRLVEAIIMAGGHLSLLNWGGVSAAHPVSTAFPASPRSYIGYPALDTIYGPSYQLPLAELEMAMTNRGLRIPVMLFPLDREPANAGPNHTKPKANEIQLVLRGSISVAREEIMCRDFKIKVSKPWNAIPEDGLFLCVVNYIRSWDSENVRVVSPMTGFVGHVRLFYKSNSYTKVERIATAPVALPFGDEGAVSDNLIKGAVQYVYV